ncbi:LysR family transcriptional regulator substrate-binding protein [Labedella endophytica]|uniref:LysR family transcriptional regulator n=1 Tax=Labedella endophytica TaxID=1523160 RepID=A0A433JR48_9MICO|nr:LysR family transcriptional regulator substrate-binding protein [Labedella endophytica]RUQ99142.1 LysR family transcriptional regulator [Labedella endophytica]
MTTGHASDDGSLTLSFVRGVLPGKWQRIWDERHPAALLHLLPTEQDRQLDPLVSGQADMALVRLPLDVDPDDFHVIPLYEELAVVLMSADSDLTAADDLGLADLDGEVVHPTDAALLETTEVVRAGVGVIVLPQSVARAAGGKGLEWRILRDAPTTRVALVWKRSTEDASPQLADDLQDFVGVVRGRRANSSRGRQPEPEPEPEKKRRMEPRKPAARAPLRPRTPRGKRPKRR